MRGAFAINRGYVCLHCRLQNAPINFQRALRNQHTSPDPQDDSFLNTAFKNLAANLTTDIKARAKRKPKKASTEYLKPAGAELQDGIQQKNDRVSLSEPLTNTHDFFYATSKLTIIRRRKDGYKRTHRPHHSQVRFQIKFKKKFRLHQRTKIKRL